MRIHQLHEEWAQERLERDWEARYLDWHSGRAFKRARARAFFASLRRVFAKAAPLCRGPLPMGRRSSDRTERREIPLGAIAGAVFPNGKFTRSLPPMPMRLLPAWRLALRDGGSAGLPVPRALRLGEDWYLAAGGDALLAYEASRALGRDALLVVAAIETPCLMDELRGSDRALPPDSARLAS